MITLVLVITLATLCFFPLFLGLHDDVKPKSLDIPKPEIKPKEIKSVEQKRKIHWQEEE